ncbi:MAG: ABC transporter substrate-binding protein [Scrofimicrobium sp.]
MKYRSASIGLMTLGIASLLFAGGCSTGNNEGNSGGAGGQSQSADVGGSPSSDSSAEPIKIGVLATLTGSFAQLGEDGVDGVKIAVDEFGGEIDGRPIELYIESTDATPASAVSKARTLIERDGVQLIIGPLSGGEGTAIADGANEWPDVTFVVAGSAAENITMRGVADNVWRTSYSGQQPMFALGEYAVNQGYEKVVTVAEDYDFPHAQVGGFMMTYCQGSGDVIEKFWSPIGSADYSAILNKIPADTDALFVALGGADMVNFINQAEEYGSLGEVPILGGTVAVDATQLASVGSKLEGVVSGSIMSGDIDTPEFKQLDEAFGAIRGRAPSLFVENYYRGTKWALLALEKIGGNIEDQEAFRTELQDTSFTAPASYVSFDEFHNVVTDTFLNKVADVDGEWRNTVIETFPAVSQFWTFDPDWFQAQPEFSRDAPASCDVIRNAE